MGQVEGNWKGPVVDPEQPPHVDGAAATYLPPPGPTRPKYTPGTEVVEGIPVREPLPCCGLGFGWTLFILSFYLGIIPWYIGSALLLYVIRKKDHRERPGCIACLLALIRLFTSPAILAVIVTVAVIVGLVVKRGLLTGNWRKKSEGNLPSAGF